MKRYEFKLEGFAEKIFKERYAIHPEETWEEACKRMASHVANAEKSEKIKYWEDKFYNELYKNRFLPGGRILYGSGRPRAALGNCFALPAEDSREGWGELISNFIVISGLGGGIGINFSGIRPNGSPINGTGGKACFTGDQRVLTKRGAIKISEIKEGIDKIITQNGEFLVNKLHKNGVSDNVVEVEFEDGRKIKTTKGHKFVCVNKKGEFEKHSIYDIYTGGVDAVPVFISHYDLGSLGDYGDKDVWLKGEIKRHFKSKNFNFKFDSEICWLMGMIVGDGHVNRDIRRNSISITCNFKQQNIVDKIMKIYRDVGLNPIVTHCPEKGRSDVNVSDSCFVDLLDKYGLLKEYSYNAEIPEMMWKMNRTCMRSFLSGLLDADGCCGKNKVISLKTTSEKLAYQVQEMFSCVGIKTVIYKNQPKQKNRRMCYLVSVPAGRNKTVFKNTFQKHFLRFKYIISESGHIKNKVSSWDFNLLSSLKDEEGINKKCTSVNKIMSLTKKNTSQRDVRRLWMYYGKKKSNISKDIEKFLFCQPTKIRNIKDLPSEEVFDITVEKEHCYLVNGMYVSNSGAVSLMRIVDAAAKEIKDGGSRRSAALFALNIDHPDIEQFISEKIDKHKLNSANMSVFFDKDPDLFFEDVKHNRDIELKWNNKVIKTVNARDIWNKLLNNAMENGEPGLLNGFYINKMNNTYYHQKIVSLNACSEIPLEKMNMCVLGSLVLPRFVDLETGEMDWEELGDAIATSIRFLDNVISVNYYPLPEIEQTVKSLRRIGMGVIGLYDMLVMCGCKYGSEKSIETIDKLFEFIKTRAYETSILLAAEKGVFPIYEQEKYMKSEFIKGLKHGIKSKIKDYGIRNASLLSLQPTGTTGLLTGFSGGIEPIISPVYKRTYTSRKSDKLENEFVVNKLFLEYVKNNRDISKFCSSGDLTMEDHLLVQSACQKHIDNAISKTIIIKDEKIEDVSKIIMKYFNKIKGLTIYRPGSRENEPIQPLSLEKSKEYVEKHLSDENIDTKQETLEKKCIDGACDLR